LANQIPGDLSTFSREVQESFYDRQLVKLWKFPDLQAEEIAKLKNVTLRIEFEDLREKIVAAAKPKSLFGNLTSYAASYLPSIIYTPETMDDWRFDFNYLAGGPDRKLHSALTPEFESKYAALATQLSMLRQQTFEQTETMKQQIAFLRENIKDENVKSGIYMKRFTSPTELSAFETQVTDVLAKQKVRVVSSSQKASEDDLLHLLDLVPDSEELGEDTSEKYSFM
jgi:hypothetical protein